jgi:C-terminal processing protease CtpA/Prc
LLVTAADAQSVDVQKSLAALDRRVRQLTAEVQSLRDSAGRATSGSEGGNSADGPQRGPADWQRMRDGRTPEDLAAMREQIQKRENERIIAAGLTPERMKEINRRAEELRVAAMQAQYEAQRNGQRVQGVDTDQALRKELGDAEYERYLKAEGRPTEVRVMDVLATSAAERSGLKAGDEILSYGGTRVFDARDLNALTMQGAAGGAVTVQVKRDGQTVQLSVPSGPLGVTAGPAGGGRQGGPGGRPGGFGGGGPGGGPGGGGPPGGFRPGG